MAAVHRGWRVLFVLLLLIAGSIVFVYVSAGPEILSARVRVEEGSRIAQTECGPIEYASVGEGAAVLLVHGAGGGVDQGLEIANTLAESGFKVITMSRFGYLRTPLPADGSPTAQARAHACLLDFLKIDRVAIIGASAGAPSSMQFALRYPARTTRLVLLVPMAFSPGTSAQRSQPPPVLEFLFNTALRWDHLFWLAMHTSRDLMVRTILATPPEVVEKADPAEQRRVERMLRNILPIASRRQGLVNDSEITKSLTRYPLEKIAAPTLVVSARDDLFETFEGARYTAERIPGARFIGYAEGSHL